MIKRESKFGTLFRHWLLANPMWSAAFELKQTQTNSISFKDVQPHQIDALLAVAESHKGILYKAPDDSRGAKPFDFFYLRKADAYVVIKYPEFFCLIDINVFIEEKRKGIRKALTSERARSIAHTTVETRRIKRI